MALPDAASDEMHERGPNSPQAILAYRRSAFQSFKRIAERLRSEGQVERANNMDALAEKWRRHCEL